MNPNPPKLFNPLTDQQWLRFDPFNLYGNGGGLNVVTSGQEAAKTSGDVLGINAAVEQVQADLSKTLSDNLPNYAVGLFGVFLIAAGTYALTR